MKYSSSHTADLIANSAWKNTYWFARMLINGDKYGAVGTSKESQIIDLANKLELILAQHQLTEAEKLSICKKAVFISLASLFKKTVKGYSLAMALYQDLEQRLNSLDDVAIFIISVRYVVVPINAAMRHVPSNDRDFCHSTATSILDTLGEKNVARVLATWDDLGVAGCLDVERSLVVSEFTKLRANLQTLDLARTEIEDNMLLTAFVQEFERRLGQKRKGRAGTSLEDVATFLFDYYGFSSHPKPDHFQTDIEVDKWFKCADGWSIGISCKRTLRERWKQVSSADSNALSRYKIKEIWHLTTYDKDLSDEKLTMLGQQRQVFYLADDSERYKTASAHIGMKDYVRPLSQLISDIRKEQRR